MERRLKLHEKLKSSTKLNKMTVKQGDLLVTLNLKQDIGNPNVEISDKVLYMLEQFVEKQQSKLLSSSIAQINKPIETAVKLANNITPSPSKRVRFDLNPNYHEIDNNVNNNIENVKKTSEETSNKDKQEQEMQSKKRIDQYFIKIQKQPEQIIAKQSTEVTNRLTAQPIEIINEPLDLSSKIIKPISSNQTVEINKQLNITEAKVSNSKNDEKNSPQKSKSKKSVEPQEQEGEDEELNLLFNCRLCRLKFNNQRALHEHVARIHGGKGGLFNCSLFADQDNNEEDYEDDDFDEDDDESNDPFNYHYITNKTKTNSANKTIAKKQIWNNQFKKKKMPNSNLPHPNVAIRVAKVAYYNSKIQTNTPTNQSNTNAFKSAIFTNGGIRGNFFSQERLPLRSCNIKMKLTPTDEQLITQDLENDRFLSYVTILKEFKTVDRNTAITYQSTNSKNTDADILTDQEARSFFKSLLVYIPLNTNTDVIRLDDLIKLSQDSEDFLNNKILTDSLRLIHELIVDAKQFGINLFDLKQTYSQRIGTDCLKMNMITVLMQLLIDNYLILAVGVVNRVYVAHEFKQHWVIESCKNQKGRGYIIQEKEKIVEDIETIEIAEEEEDSKIRVSARKIEKKTEETIVYKQFKPVCLIPRPWRYIDGLLNRPVLQKMFETILIYLKSYPDATFETISEHFCPVLQPIMTLELLEMLEKCKCIGRIYLKKEAECNLFSNFQNGSDRVLNEEDLDGDEIISYHCKPNSIFTIKKLFQSMTSTTT